MSYIICRRAPRGAGDLRFKLDLLFTNTRPFQMKGGVPHVLGLALWDSICCFRGIFHFCFPFWLKCASYRPISLLNSDYKLISKVLGNRLSLILPKIINPDQSGFIQKHLSANNLSRFFNIIHLAKSGSDHTVAVALDAEKAFDRLEWPYLFKVLTKLGFGQVFISWVRTLYHKPKARITTNGQISSQFSLNRSSRQGCPLSPSLFVLAIEPLAEAIRRDPDIKVFKVGQTTHEINLLADYVLLYLTDPFHSLTRLQDLLGTNGTFSGYNVNYDPINNIQLLCV